MHLRFEKARSFSAAAHRGSAHNLNRDAVHQDGSARVAPLLVRSAIWARGRRREFLNADLFADPAWDMLLELYCTHLEQQRLSVSNLCMGSGVPDTTALRWIRKLEQDGLVVRRDDPTDARRVFVELSAEGEAAMRGYFEALPPGAVLV